MIEIKSFNELKKLATIIKQFKNYYFPSKRYLAKLPEKGDQPRVQLLTLLFLFFLTFLFITQPVSSQNNNVDLPSNFPQSNYTPFGYLDNPHHTFLHRSGIIRSVPPIGFGYWCRSLPWPYGEGALRQINYLSFLYLSINIDGIHFHTMEDFKSNKVKLVSKYHTKNMMSYDWEFKGITLSTKYFLPIENSLACLLEIKNNSRSDKIITIHATNIYGYPEEKWWGCDGVTSKYNKVVDAGVSKIWAYGDVFLIGSDQKSISYKATLSEEQWIKWVSENDLSNNEGATGKIPGPIYTVQSYSVNVQPGKVQSMLICLTRGKNEKFTVSTYKDVLQKARNILTKKLIEDDEFYANTPLLVGDWPSEWKHGWIYDWETLRMNIKPPVGIYKHHWDAMQIHSPRVVLGETLLDGMCMSYADIELAKDIIYGIFADAPMPNIPCSREDGSVNMICANGKECGTAPIWGVPFHVINSIYQRCKDDKWLKELYPHLKSFLVWWLENRTDEEGWFHCACSWESGQDGSKRFLVPGHEPGAAAEFVRTVDIEAAVAEAMGNMVLFAEVAGESEDKDYWNKMAEQRRERVQAMYVEGWFRDFDARTGKPIILKDYYDVMMLLPVSLRIATKKQMKELEPMFYHFRDNPRFWLEWPSFMFPFTEAAWNASMRLFTSEEVVKIGNRIYPRLDEKNLQQTSKNKLPPKYNYRIPGVADEFWPISENNPGGCENYGWGATFPTLVIRNVIGFRELNNTNGEQFILAPSIPSNLSKVGKSFGISNLNFRKSKFNINYNIKSNSIIEVELACQFNHPKLIKVLTESGKVITSTKKKSGKANLKFKGINGNIYRISLENED